MGLLCEYKRFLCYDWMDIINIHSELVEINKNNNIIVKEINLRQFNDDFNETCSEILNILNIYNESDGQWLMNEFVNFDLHTANHYEGIFVNNHI